MDKSICMKPLLLLMAYPLFFACSSGTASKPKQPGTNQPHPTSSAQQLLFDSSWKTIHVFVALCDNTYQGIIPVPAAIGNGEDKEHNLYWGCSLGISAYFKASKEWKLVRKYQIDSIKLERLVFQHLSAKYFLVADAYRGKDIKTCTIDFLNACSGQLKDTIQVKGIL
jgi:hypothetical protein